MKKRLFSMLLALCMVLVAAPAALAEETATKVADYDALVDALEEGKDVVLTKDIVAPDKAVLTISNQTLDLGGYSLTLNGESGKLTNGTITNGTIEITTYEGDTVADGMFDVDGTKSYVDGVTFHSDEFALYAIFDLKAGDLEMTDCVIDMANNAVGAGGGLIFFNDGDSGSKLTMTKCNVTGTDVGDFISNGIVEMNNCEITLTGTVKDGLDNGINGAALTLNNTDVTIDGATGRGITTDGDDIAINGTSNVTLTNCAEGGIRYKASATITVEETASVSGTVKVDTAATTAKINNAVIPATGETLPAVTVQSGAVSVPVDNAVAAINDVEYATLLDAIKAANANEDTTTIAVLQNCNFVNRNSNGTLAESKITTKVILDLNGKTVTSVFEDGTNSPVGIWIASTGNLTIKDSSEDETGLLKAGNGTAGNAVCVEGTFTLESGNIYSNNNGIYGAASTAVITINGGTVTAEPATKDSAVMYLSGNGANVTITDGTMKGYNGILLWDNVTINMTGGSIDAKGSVGIQGNGSKDNTEINISGDASVTGYYAAIYHPQGGKLTIADNATLTGWTGIVVKGGDVTISGGTISGTGAADTYAPVSSGFIDTGDALYIEHYDNSTNSENYGTPTVTITGGTFISENAEAVASYANTANADKGVESLAEFVEGGSFSTPVDEDLLDESLNAELLSASTGMYSYYETVSDALAASEPGDTVTALNADEGDSETVTYTLTLKYGMRQDDTEITVPADTEITLPVLSQRGYIFMGWFDGTRLYRDTYTVNGNVTLTAIWESTAAPSAPTYSVTVPDADNGAVKVSPANASKGATVTITVTPDAGYVLDELYVIDADGNEIELTYVSDDKYSFKMPADKVEVYASFSKIEAVNPFSDVADGSYYYDAVLWAVENGITTGTGDGTTFSPNMVCSRAQVVTFLWRAAGCPAPKSTVMPFSDVAADAYYYDAVLWAVENGVTTGTGDGTTFSPDAECTRAQIVTFLYRAQGSDTAADVNPFVDVAADAYYTEAVLWAVENDITAGTGNGTTFSPDMDCSRAQVVTFLYRCVVE